MKQLNTIQKLENLNDVFALDEPGPGGAHHLYQVCKHNTGRISEEDGTFRIRPEDMVLTVQMQCGGRREAGSISVAVDADLLEIVRDRLRAYQTNSLKESFRVAALYGVKTAFPNEGPYVPQETGFCHAYGCALAHIEEALMWLNRGVEDRITRGVLGTEQE